MNNEYRTPNDEVLKEKDGSVRALVLRLDNDYSANESPHPSSTPSSHRGGRGSQGEGRLEGAVVIKGNPTFDIKRWNNE